MQLRLDGARPLALRGLLLEHAERLEPARTGEHSFDGVDAERPDQLAFEIGTADGVVPEHAAEEMRFVLVAETANRGPERKARDEPRDCVRAADGNDPDPFGREIPFLATSQELEHQAIAGALDGDDDLCFHD